MTRLVSAGMIVAFLAMSTASQADSTVSQSDFAGIHQIEISFHKAAATQDLDLMVSLFAADATLTADGKTFVGKDQVRNYFATVASPFQPGNHWAAYTPAYKIRLSVNDNQGTLYFECLYIDAATGQIKAHTNSNDTLVRSGDRWLIKTMTAGKVTEF